MAFIGAKGELEYRFATGGVTAVRIFAGFDPEKQTTYYLSASLDSSLSNPVIQFSFWVTEVNEDGEEQDFWNGEDTEFIPREERAQISLKLKTAAEMLISAERPRCVGLCAADAQERAYDRFLLVAEVFRENWYRVTELEPYLGSRAWLMERAGL